MAEQQEERAFVSVRVPISWLEPMKYKAKNGTIYDMFAVVMPQDTWIDGMDVSGYQCRVFANRYNLQQYHDQQPLITLSVRKDDRMVLRAMDDEGIKVTDSIKVDSVFDFVHVLKEQRERYTQDIAHAQTAPTSEYAGELRAMSDAIAGRVLPDVQRSANYAR